MANPTAKLILRLCGSIVMNVGLYVLALFLPAGTWRWWRAWVVIALLLLGSVWAIASLYRQHRAVLEERLKPVVQKGQPVIDRILVLVFLVSYLVSCIINVFTNVCGCAILHPCHSLLLPRFA